MSHFWETNLFIDIILEKNRIVFRKDIWAFLDNIFVHA